MKYISLTHSRPDHNWKKQKRKKKKKEMHIKTQMRATTSYDHRAP